VSAAVAPCRDCSEPRGGRYGLRKICWPCWCKRAGYDPLRADRPTTRRSAQRDVFRFVERLSECLGPPVSTPELISVGDGKLERARYRVFRWCCPACGGGESDPDRIWRPFFVDSDGAVTCNALGCLADRRDDVLRGLLAGEETVG
jgi:hypothetical protein